MKTQQNNSIIKKNVASIEVKAKLSLLERKLSNVLLFNAYDSLLEKRQHQIDIKTMALLMGFDSNNTQVLKDALKTLLNSVIEWNYLNKNNKEVWGASSMLASGEIENGVCTYEYSQALAEKLYNPEIYARINLSVQRNISSSYGLALYEICVRYLGVKSTGWIDIDDFRALLGAHDIESYKAFKCFNDAVIKPAVKEINKATNIYIEVELKKEKKRVIEIRFDVKENPQLSLLEYEQEDEVSETQAYKLLLSKGISKTLARQWVIEHGEAYILEKLAVTEHAEKAKKLKSVSGFLTKAIEGDYKNAEIEQKKAIEKARTERANQAERERKIERLSGEIRKIERANRDAKKALVLAHLATLSADEVARLKEEFGASISNEFARVDFRKKGWESIHNERAIIELVGARYSLNLPTIEETAQSLKLPTIAELEAKKNELEAVK